MTSPQNQAFTALHHGATFRAAAAQAGVDESTVRRWARAAGITINRHRGRQPLLNPEHVATMWNNGTTSIATIATNLNVSKQAVRTALTRAGITPQPRQSHQGNRGARVTPHDLTTLRHQRDAALTEAAHTPRTIDWTAPKGRQFLTTLAKHWNQGIPLTPLTHQLGLGPDATRRAIHHAGLTPESPAKRADDPS